jgi:hypothetical protein
LIAPIVNGAGLPTRGVPVHVASGVHALEFTFGVQ